MSQIRPEYETLDEFTKLASGIQSKYPEIFDGIDIKKIRCVAITNKTRKPEKRFWDVVPVKMPIKMDCPYNYYVVVFLEDWNMIDESHKLLLVADAILSIPGDDTAEEGKVIQQDMKDFAVMFRTFGVDYMDKDTVPDILKDKVTWISR